MGQGTGSGSRSRKRLPALLAAVLLVALLIGAALLAGAKAPWDVGRVGWPGTTYPPASATVPADTAAIASTGPTLEASAIASASAGLASTPTGASPAAVPHATPAPQLAELGIGGYSNPWLICGIEFDMNISVRNDGPAPSRSTTARLVDRFGSTVAAQMVVAVPALAVDARVDIHFPITVRTGCGVLHTMTITVDPDNLVPETYEDNTLERTHTPLAKPNLTLAGLTVPATPTCNASFTVSVTVVNNGYAQALDGKIRFVDKHGSSTSSTTYVSFPSVPAASTRTVSATIPASMTWCNSVHQLVATVDSDGTVDEMFEDDNTVSGDFTPLRGG